MIGFIKWLIQEYKDYKVSAIIKPSTEDTERLQIKNYLNCLEAGFSEEQIRSLLNLIYCTKGGTK